MDGQTVSLKILLWEADVHDENGKTQKAANIRAWVADVLSEQSKIVRSVWRRLPKPAELNSCDSLAKRTVKRWRR